MCILITGSNGFTGGYLTSCLTDLGFTVLGLKSNLMDFFSLSKEIALIKPKVIFHLGAISHTTLKNYKKYYEINLLGTRNLLETLQGNSNLKQVFVISSASIYGNGHQLPIKEDFTPNPDSDYAVSKLASELVAKLFMEKLPITILRPFNYTGIGQDKNFVIPKIINHFKKRKSHIELGNINVEREFNDVRNVVNLYSKLIMKVPTRGIFNICTGKSFSIKEIIEKCEMITGHRIKIKFNNTLIRFNDCDKLVGNGDHLKEFVNPNLLYNIDETLHWMLTTCNDI